LITECEQNTELVGFKWEHLDNIKMRDFDKRGFSAVPDSSKQLEYYLNNGIVYTGKVYGCVAMIGGVCTIWPKVGFVWVLTSPLVERYKVFFHKACIQIIEMGIDLGELHRVETTIKDDHIVSRRWAERLGFEQEGFMRKYDTEGNNYCLYARIIE
jgi:hypothetical protein